MSHRPVNCSFVYPLDDEFFAAFQAEDYLRGLVLIGSTECRDTLYQLTLAKNATISSLQVLCLREVSLPKDFEFPMFPQLHTLRIAQCYVLKQNASGTQGKTTTYLTPTRFPALRSLDTYVGHWAVPRIRP